VKEKLTPALEVPANASGPLRFCGSQLLIHKLTGAIADTAIAVISAVASGVATAITSIVTTIAAAITSGVATAITSIVTTITAAITSGVATTITATITRAITATVATAVTTITAAIDTARRRRRRSVDLAARRRSNLAARRRRRRSVDLATRRNSRRGIRDRSKGNDRTTGNSEVGCFGLGGNGGGSEREGRREHDGYPQLHRSF
jgi:uncharacterized membrane protein YgcG